VTPPTYSSPTQASNAKVVAVPNLRRVMSGHSSLSPSSPLSVSRAPSPPPPEVPWTIAAIELSKLLIPTDRQTESCRHEDLTVEATRARKDRQSILDLGNGDRPASRVGLRERKAKIVASIEEDDEVQTKGRRKTVASSTALISEKVPTCLTQIYFFGPRLTYDARLRLAVSPETRIVASRPDDNRGALVLRPRCSPLLPKYRPTASKKRGIAPLALEAQTASARSHP